MRSKRQTTMAKLNRERSVKEKREKKKEKKEARAAERARIEAGLPPEGEDYEQEFDEQGEPIVRDEATQQDEATERDESTERGGVPPAESVKPV
ncbi:MAG: hypothetical protein H0W87_08655 [Actinobacteria bacterium]|nr:hypothetical protein [Actinomycetota bacterium]